MALGMEMLKLQESFSSSFISLVDFAEGTAVAGTLCACEFAIKLLLAKFQLTLNSQSLITWFLLSFPIMWSLI